MGIGHLRGPGWVYFQWQPLVELDARATDAGGGASAGNVVVQRTYIWGPDLSGSVTAAGGIGGLLASQDRADPNDPNDDRSFIHFYDGNGNTGQLVEWYGPTAGWDGLGGLQAARYEYDAYGNVLNEVTNATQSGDYAEENAWRFSTKTFDPVSGLGYWGYRWYSARMGRWCSRDPIGEGGGFLFYNMCFNRSNQTHDAIGLACGGPKTYAIDGTAFGPNGSSIDPDAPTSNVWGFCKDVIGEYYYLEGVGSAEASDWEGQVFGGGTEIRVAATSESEMKLMSG